MPTAYSRMMGIPKGYQPSLREAEEIAAPDLLFPFKPRRDGAVFDGFVSNLTADRFPLEHLNVPTLVISARDDPLAPYRTRRELRPAFRERNSKQSKPAATSSWDTTHKSARRSPSSSAR